MRKGSALCVSREVCRDQEHPSLPDIGLREILNEEDPAAEAMAAVETVAAGAETAEMAVAAMAVMVEAAEIAETVERRRFRQSSRRHSRIINSSSSLFQGR